MKNQIDNVYIPIVCFLFSFVFQILCMNLSVNLFDEGIVLSGASFITHGYKIYKDFNINYGPLEFYLVSFFLKAFGHYVFAERLCDLIIKSLIVFLVSLILKQYQYKIGYILWISFIVNLWLIASQTYSYPVFATLLICFIAVWIYQNGLINFGINYFSTFILGLCISIASLIRYDIGFAILLAFVLNFMFILPQYYLNQKFSKLVKTLICYLLILFLGFLILNLCFIASYVYNNQFEDFIFDVFTHSYKFYIFYRSLPFPPLKDFTTDPFSVTGSYLPLVLVIYNFITLIYTFMQHTKDGFKFKNSLNITLFLKQKRSDNFNAKLILFTLSVAFFFKGLIRVGEVQMIMCTVTSFLCYLVPLPFQIQSNEILNFIKSFFRILLLSILTLFTLMSLIISLTHLYENLNQSFVYNKSFMKTTESSDNNCNSTLRIWKSICFHTDDDHQKAVNFILNNTHEGEKIYVGSIDHQKTFANDTTFYFLSKTLPITKWSNFDPALQSKFWIQKEIINSFEINQPNFIVLESVWETVNEPNKSSETSGVDLLDNYIQKHYFILKDFNSVKILKLKKQKT